MEVEEPCFNGVAEERMTVPNGLCVCIASLLVAGGSQGAVHVWAEQGERRTAIANLSPEKLTAVVPRVALHGEFALRHDAADATVRLYCQILSDEAEKDGDAADPDAPPATARLVEPTVVDGVELEPLYDDEYPEPPEAGELSDDDDERDVVHFLVVDIGPPPRDGEADVYEPAVEYQVLSEEDEAESYDSDNGESSRGSIPLVPVPAVSVVTAGEFLGAARYAAVENTAGFMRIAAAEATGEGGKEIVVLYRYTRFSRTWSGRHGVEPCRRTKQHYLRFAVPAAGDVAGSLAWAGSALGPLVYPALFRRQLHELWSTLSTLAMKAVPPGAARIQVVVDVGILRREDYTEERMGHMPGAMESKMREAWPEFCHVGMDLHLPEPMPDAGEQGGDTRTAKRRKVVAGDDESQEEDECAVCFERLERGLAAWPGCRHVFHGECLEKTLAGSDMCPLCRTKLSDQLAR